MSNSSVYLNDEFVGTWPYGYSSFCFDLTDRIRFGETNLLAVGIDSLPLAARWYPGAGIYRHVRMVLTNPIHVARWGTYIVTRRKDPSSLLDRYRLRWNEVLYEPGVLKAVSFDRDGNSIAETELRTAGAAARIELSPNRQHIAANGRDLCFITVQICDQNGIFCPLADNLVRFNLSGPGKIVAVGNGDPTSTDPYLVDYRKAFHGMCLLIVSARKDDYGEITITALSDGLAEAEISLLCR